MEYLANIHPGEVLQEEFLKPLEITLIKRHSDSPNPDQ